MTNDYAPTATIETSVILSALIFSGGKPTSPAVAVLLEVDAGEVLPAMSDDLAKEIYRKLVSCRMKHEEALEVVQELRSLAVYPTSIDNDHHAIDIRDATDRFVVALAIASSSWCIVTQDNDLLQPTPHVRPEGLRPEAFLARLRDLQNNGWSASLASCAYVPAP